MNIVLNFTEILAHLSLNILAKSIHSGKMRKTHNHVTNVDKENPNTFAF